MADDDVRKVTTLRERVRARIVKSGKDGLITRDSLTAS
jgi:hypothetical protein